MNVAACHIKMKSQSEELYYSRGQQRPANNNYMRTWEERRTIHAEGKTNTIQSSRHMWRVDCGGSEAFKGSLWCSWVTSNLTHSSASSADIQSVSAERKSLLSRKKRTGEKTALCLTDPPGLLTAVMVSSGVDNIQENQQNSSCSSVQDQIRHKLIVNRIKWSSAAVTDCCETHSGSKPTVSVQKPDGSFSSEMRN